MIEEAAVRKAQKNKEERERLIRENIQFICRCASVTVKRYISNAEEEFSIAQIAFNAAVDSYEREKGSFPAYAAICIRSALISWLRKEKKHQEARPMSSLAQTDDSGREIPFDPEDPFASFSDASLEMFSLKLELEPFGIDFFDLPKVSPRAAKTRELCRKAARFVSGDGQILERLRKSGRLPYTELLDGIPAINKKVLERHRVYIIACSLIYAGNYTILRSYLEEGGIS